MRNDTLVASWPDGVRARDGHRTGRVRRRRLQDGSTCPAASILTVDWWERTRRRLRGKLVFALMFTLLASSLVQSGVRDHHPAGVVIGILGLVLGPWATFRRWKDLREHSTRRDLS